MFSACSVAANKGYYISPTGAENPGKVYDCGATAPKYDNSNATTAVTNCAECTFDATKVALAVICTKCTSGKYLKVAYSGATTVFTAVTARTCESSADAD